MNIIQYVPKFRDNKGRFTNLRRKMLKLIMYQVILLSFITNVWFVRHVYVVTCSAGGHFMTQEKCGELAQAKFDSAELARVEADNAMLANNQDLLK